MSVAVLMRWGLARHALDPNADMKRRDVDRYVFAPAPVQPPIAVDYLDRLLREEALRRAVAITERRIDDCGWPMGFGFVWGNGG